MRLWLRRDTRRSGANWAGPQLSVSTPAAHCSDCVKSPLTQRLVRRMHGVILLTAFGVLPPGRTHDLDLGVLFPEYGEAHDALSCGTTS